MKEDHLFNPYQLFIFCWELVNLLVFYYSSVEQERDRLWFGDVLRDYQSSSCVSFTFTENILLLSLLVTKCVGFFHTKQFCNIS